MKMTNRTTSVSYTHLDVYKRQGSVPATILTLYAIKIHGQTPEFAKMIKKFLGFALFATAALVIGRGYIVKFSKDHSHDSNTRTNAILTIITGAGSYTHLDVYKRQDFNCACKGTL